MRTMTTPVVADWDQDGLNDLVMLDHEGYLALFRRQFGLDFLVARPSNPFGAGQRTEAAQGAIAMQASSVSSHNIEEKK